MRMIMNKFVLHIIFLMTIFSSINVFAQSEGVKLSSESWETHRHGESILKNEAIANVIIEWLSKPQLSLEIRYPGGEEGELWVEELRDWLVSLGIPSSVIQLVPGSEAKDIINMSVIEVVRIK